jgi:hypothetical protein
MQTTCILGYTKIIKSDELCTLEHKKSVLRFYAFVVYIIGYQYDFFRFFFETSKYDI